MSTEIDNAKLSEELCGDADYISANGLSLADEAATMRQAADTIDSLRARIDKLIDAVEHIQRVAQSSRTDTRRLRWIAYRAACANSGSDNWRTVDMPKLSGAQIEIAKLRDKLREAEVRAVPEVIKQLADKLKNGAYKVMDSGYKGITVNINDLISVCDALLTPKPSEPQACEDVNLDTQANRDRALREVASWPQWKRDVMLTKFSKLKTGEEG